MKKVYLLLVLTITLFFIFLQSVNVLEVRVDKTEQLVYQQRAYSGDYFDVQWIHSVTLQPVVETYRLEAPGIIPLVKMVFDEFGPNLPAHPEFNQYWIIEDGKFTVMGYDIVFERVPVTIGSLIADHTLVYNGIITPLKDVYRPGGYVKIGFTQKKLAQFIIEEVEIWQKKQKKQLI